MVQDGLRPGKLMAVVGLGGSSFYNGFSELSQKCPWGEGIF